MYAYSCCFVCSFALYVMALCSRKRAAPQKFSNSNIYTVIFWLYNDYYYHEPLDLVKNPWFQARECGIIGTQKHKSKKYQTHENRLSSAHVEYKDLYTSVLIELEFTTCSWCLYYSMSSEHVINFALTLCMCRAKWDNYYRQLCKHIIGVNNKHKYRQKPAKP